LFESFEVLRNAPMKAYTSLRLGGPADYLAFPRSGEEIAALLAEAGKAGLPVTVIGRGSNLLVLDGGIRGLVIRVERGMKAVRAEGNRLRAQAGASLASLAAAAAAAGLQGVAFASGIPGAVGGGLVMNAGAYGGELADVTAEVHVLRRDGTPLTLSREELDFGYRHSLLQERDWIVTEAVFELSEGDPAEIREKMAELNARRQEKQPLDQPSAGSTFRRPEGFFAAALIDQCGLKGYRIGGAMVSKKHAGFLLNTGESSADFLALMRKVQQIVEDRTGVRLEPEIRILGEET